MFSRRLLHFARDAGSDIAALINRYGDREVVRVRAACRLVDCEERAKAGSA